MKSLMVLFSYHHKNTEKIANVFARVLDAQVKTPQQVDPEELQEYGLVGFGSGIIRNITNLCLTLPTYCHKSSTGKHSFSQLVL